MSELTDKKCSAGDGFRTVLHVCSDFANQDVYTQLVRHLSRRNLAQLVFVPVRTSAEARRQPNDVAESIQYRFAHILHPLHRFLFRTKIRKVYSKLRAEFDVRRADVVHSHFLYSDGAVALKLKLELGLPYVVAVRNTDINYFMRYRPDLGALGRRVLSEAAYVILLSPTYRDQLLQKVGRDLRAGLEAKTRVIPNGLSADWFVESSSASRHEDTALRLLYVGDFSRNKNLRNTLKAADLAAKQREVKLTIVGGGGDGESELHAMLASGDYPFAKCVGRIDNPDRLREIYRSHDVFVMPSFRETFGVAYVEALSQGVPVIHSAGQGIDGFFDDNQVSMPVDPTDPEDIAARIAELASRRQRIHNVCARRARRFSWNIICDQYSELYGQVAK